MARRERQREAPRLYHHRRLGLRRRDHDEGRSHQNDIGEIAYFLSALATPNPTVAHFTIEHDGIVEELDGICCMAGNTSVIQNDINLFPNCRMDDGMVDIVVIEPVRTMQLLPR